MGVPGRSRRGMGGVERGNDKRRSAKVLCANGQRLRRSQVVHASASDERGACRRFITKDIDRELKEKTPRISQVLARGMKIGTDDQNSK